MKRSRLAFVLLVLLGVMLACNLPGSATPEPQPPAQPVPVEPEPPPEIEPPVVAEPPAEDEPAPPPVDEPENPPVEDQPPPEEPNPPQEEPPPTEESPPEPVEAPVPAGPVGFMVGDVSNELVSFYDTQGQIIGNVFTPGISEANPWHVHYGGKYNGNPQDNPLIYHSWGDIGMIKKSLNGNANFVISQIDVTDFRGANGQNAYVYTQIEYTDTALLSYLYARGASGGGASFFWDRSDPMGWRMQPLEVEAENDQIKGVWYTLSPWGIGGDIVFPPRKGLFYLNANNLDHQLHLTEDFNPVGMSPDMLFVAYTPANDGFIDGASNQLTIYNLETMVGVYIDLDPSSDRGAGYAVFSPDNAYVAWMEGSGWQMAEVPNFTSRVRIADTDGTILADIPASTFASAAVDPTVSHVVPVGWLDGETLLVEARGEEWYNPALIKVRYDGSGITKIGQGSFAGFIYP